MKKLFCFILSIVNQLIPKSEKYISIYGRRMLSDNAEALLDYLVAQNYNDNYKVYLLLHKNVYCNNYLKLQNIFICTNAVKTLWILFRSMYIFHTHGMAICAMHPAKRQIIFNLWHGSALKSIGRMAGTITYPKTDSYLLSASPFFASINTKCFGHTEKQMFIGSNPRNDLLFNSPKPELLSSLSSEKKIVMFMPTYRKSTELGEIDCYKEFPLLNADNIAVLDTFLEDKSIIFLIKPHPYQDKISFLKEPYKNIEVIYNEDLRRLNLRLYKLLGCADALITDFSSVYFDYLLLDKPIGFTIDDMESYRNNRGYTVNNPFELMPGHKIRNITELENFIIDIANGFDPYKKDRNRVNELVNTYKTADASRRILDFVGIKK